MLARRTVRNIQQKGCKKGGCIKGFSLVVSMKGMWIAIIGLTQIPVEDYNITFFMTTLWISYISPFVWGATNTSGQKEKCKIT